MYHYRKNIHVKLLSVKSKLYKRMHRISPFCLKTLNSCTVHTNYSMYIEISRIAVVIKLLTVLDCGK